MISWFTFKNLTQKSKVHTNIRCKVWKFKIISVNFYIMKIYASATYTYVQNISFSAQNEACI